MTNGNFEQIFDAKKLRDNGIINPDQFIKQKIVDLIKKNAEEFFNDAATKTFFNKIGIKDVNDIDLNSLFIKRFKAE